MISLSDYALIALLVVSAGLHWYVSKHFFGVEKHLRPAIFQNAGLTKLLVPAPQFGFLIVIILGFILTEHGWWYLIAVLIAGMSLATVPKNKPF